MNHPLPIERLRQLRENNEARIEKYRATMLQKKKSREEGVYEQVCKDFESGKFSRNAYAGFFLYWAEGTKSAPYTTSLTNSDPAMMGFYVSWLLDQNVPKKDLSVKLHVYENMDIKSVINFWSKRLKIPVAQFYKPYVKKSSERSKTYKGMFEYGTCTVTYHNRDMYEYVMAVMKYLRKMSI